jgi:CheY-like chemotaxis protein
MGFGGTCRRTVMAGMSAVRASSLSRRRRSQRPICAARRGSRSDRSAFARSPLARGGPVGPRRLASAVSLMRPRFTRIAKLAGRPGHPRPSARRRVLHTLHLPGIDGITAAQRLRADPATQHAKLRAVTALALNGDRERILAAGLDGYVSTPFRIAELRRRRRGGARRVSVPVASGRACRAHGSAVGGCRPPAIDMALRRPRRAASAPWPVSSLGRKA